MGRNSPSLDQGIPIAVEIFKNCLDTPGNFLERLRELHTLAQV